MRMCKESIPIDKKNAWKYPKFHKVLHIVDDMSCFGSPLNFCAQGPESLLKDAANTEASWKTGTEVSWGLIQRTSICATFDVQCRDWHCSYMHLGHRGQGEFKLWWQRWWACWHHCNLPRNKKATCGCIWRVKSGKQVQYEIDWDTRTHSDLMKLPPDLVKFVCESFKEGETICFCMAYRRDVHKFQCHLCFQSDSGIHE